MGKKVSLVRTVRVLFLNRNKAFPATETLPPLDRDLTSPPRPAQYQPAVYEGELYRIFVPFDMNALAVPVHAKIRKLDMRGTVAQDIRVEKKVGLDL